LKKNKKFWQFRAADDDSNVGELLIYGIIGDWLWDDVSPKQFKEDLDALSDVEEIRVFINSDGGDVFAGQAIYSMLKRHKAKISVYIDGLAASIASVIAMAGDVVYMPKNAMMMVHNPWTIARGDANEFRELAEVLDKVRDSLIVVYQDKTGLEREEIIELLDAETWMTAEEAVEKGFADEIEETKQVVALFDKSNNKLIVNGQEFDLSRFQNLPQLDHIPEAKAKGKGREQNESIVELIDSMKAHDQVLKEVCNSLNDILKQLNTQNESNKKESLVSQRQPPLDFYEKRLQVNERVFKY